MRERVREEGKSMAMKLWRVMSSGRQLKGWHSAPTGHVQGFCLQLFSTVYYSYGENFLAPRPPVRSSEPRRLQPGLGNKKHSMQKNSIGNVSDWWELQQGKRCQGAHRRKRGLLSFDFLMQLLNILNSLGGTQVSKRLFQIKYAGVWKWPPNCLNWALIL